MHSGFLTDCETSFLQWEHAAFQGAGIEDFSEDHDLVEYLGHFHQGQRHGTGICRYADGSIYVGPWHQGSQHGLGRMVDFGLLKVTVLSLM